MTTIEITPDIIKRFKILCFLCLELDVLGDKMQELGNALDEEHPQSLQALSFYEDEIIKLLEE
jgi:hypothetical protein